MEALGVFTADDHGESVLETEWLGDFEIESLGVALLDATVDVVRVGGGGFVEDCGQGGAGVLDIEVEVAGEERFLTEECAAEIGFAFDVNAGASFDVLGEELGEYDLFGEKFGTDGQMGLVFSAAGKNRKRERDEKDNAETLKGRREEGHKRREEFNTEFTGDGAWRSQRRGRVGLVDF
jgi:hypothetical protein